MATAYLMGPATDHGIELGEVITVDNAPYPERLIRWKVVSVEQDRIGLEPASALDIAEARELPNR